MLFGNPVENATAGFWLGGQYKGSAEVNRWIGAPNADTLDKSIKQRKGNRCQLLTEIYG